MHLIRKPKTPKSAYQDVGQSNSVPENRGAKTPTGATRSVFIKPDMRDYSDGGGVEADLQAPHYGLPEDDKKLKETNAKDKTSPKPHTNIVWKTMETMKHAAGKMYHKPTPKEENSVKTALSISTIPPEEAAKYSFLRQDQIKPPTLVTNFEEPHKSELDLFSAVEEPQRLDMKNLEIFFNKPPVSNTTATRSAGKGKNKSKNSLLKKHKSKIHFMKALSKSSERLEKTLEKSDTGRKPETKSPFPRLFKQRKSKEHTNSKECEIPVGYKK